MKLLHTITTISRGGAESHLLELIRGQVAMGHEIQVAYLRGDGYFTAALAAMGVQVHALGLRRYGDLVPLWRLRGVLEAFRPNLIHGHLPPAELYTLMAMTGLPPTPFVISKHNDEPFYKAFGERWVGSLVANRARRIIAISDAVCTYAAGGGLDYPADRVVTIRYGIDPAPFEAVAREESLALRRDWGVPDDAYLIGTAARFVPQKALHILLDGFARYQARAGVPVKLAMVGRGPLEPELRAQADRLGIGDHLIWAGFREDIPVVMNAFDLFTLTSIYEGFGLVLLESQAAGRPVVASRVSAIPEVVADGETGLLVPPLDADALASAFATLETPEARRRFGEAGRERVKRHFTLSTMVARTAEVYEASLAPGAR